MQPVDISIVIVNYNVKDFLLQCLRSIEKAITGLKCEIIVVDNHSSDGSVAFLKPLFPDVEFIALSENIGFGRANNVGIEKALGKYILILNPDTILEDNTLNKMFSYMESSPEVGISGCNVLNPDGTFQIACRRGYPTPWASFSKLFGLQKLFPKSSFFARYNQTFRSIDETYYIDAVVGAFMFCRKEALQQVGGFDPDFFMYAEDIDLCFRVSKLGWKIAYYHSTSIIHYKGESTKRSSINEVKHFYQAMEIFTRKHHSSSAFLLIFLRLGIWLRSILAYGNKFKRDILLIFSDLLIINLSLILATKIRFDEFFNFPSYAYPTVFIVISIVLLVSMISVGEYFETKPTIRKSFFGFMISFFILSSLTYFFNQYAFSRGILIMTIGFSILISSLIRGITELYAKIAGKESDRRIAIIGINRQAENIIKALQTGDTINANIIGLISTSEINYEIDIKLPVIGNIEYLIKILEDYKIHEVIITDDSISRNDIIGILSKIPNPNIRFHIANEYEELIASKIVNEISGTISTIPISNISKLRFKLIKRIVDIIISLFLLSIGFPLVSLILKRKQKVRKDLFNVLFGKNSIIGLYPIDNESKGPGKLGLIGLAHISKPEQLSKQAIRNLNNYYIQNFNLSLDMDIFIKSLFRK